MTLPADLQRLPPQALDLIRYLGTQDQGASVDTIIDGTGLSERMFRKSIRRLVTRYYVEMPADEFYRLTASGRQAASTLRDYDGADPAAAVRFVDRGGEENAPKDKPAPAPAAPRAQSAPAASAGAPATSPDSIYHTRRLVIVMTRELVSHAFAVLKIGFDRPAADAGPLRQPGRIVLRVSAPGCDVEPVERPLDVTAAGPAGPVEFRVMPRREGSQRIKVEAYQLVTSQDFRLVGGLYVDLNVAGFPTPASGEIRALGAMVRLHPGAA